MKKAKAEVNADVAICKYCGAKTFYKDNICGNCREKKKLMQGWHWEYNPKKTIKI